MRTTVAAFSFFLGTAIAQSSLAATTLPSVATIHRRFVAALGGAAAISRPRYETVYGHFDVYEDPGRFKRIAFVRYGAAGFKQLQISAAPNGRNSRFGTYEGISWGISPYPRGVPQIARGDLLRSALRDADIYYWAHISRYFRYESVVGIEPFAEHTCYHVRGVTNWGNENNQYFDASTGLLVGYAFHQWNATNTGRETTLTRQVFDDYRDFDGLVVPMRITTTDGGRLQAIEQDTELDFTPIADSIFALPPSVIATLNALRSPQ